MEVAEIRCNFRRNNNSEELNKRYNNSGELAFQSSSLKGKIV